MSVYSLLAWVVCAVQIVYAQIDKSYGTDHMLNLMELLRWTFYLTDLLCLEHLLGTLYIKAGVPALTKNR